MPSWSSPFTYKAVEVIFGSIYFYFHLQTAPNLQDCSHSHNLPTFPEFTLVSFNRFLNVKALVGAFNMEKVLLGTFSVIVKLQTSRMFVSGCTLHSGAAA